MSGTGRATHTWNRCTATCVRCGITEIEALLDGPGAACVVWATTPGVQADVCEGCGQEIHIGDWPFCPHGRATPSKGFEPYFDVGLGHEVTGWGDVRKSMREQKLDFRDHPSQAKTNAYVDRAKRLREREGRR